MRGMRKTWLGIDVRQARSNQAGVVTLFRAWIQLVVVDSVQQGKPKKSE